MGCKLMVFFYKLLRENLSVFTDLYDVSALRKFANIDSDFLSKRFDKDYSTIQGHIYWE